MKFKCSSNQRANSIFETMETNGDSGEKERLRFMEKCKDAVFFAFLQYQKTASETRKH